MRNVRRISRQLFAYGTADVMVLVVNFLLLPVYTRVLTPREYGGLAMLLVFEGVLKVVNRWGLDASYLRFYYESPTDDDRRTLAGTIAVFIGAANGAIALLLLLAAGPANWLLFKSLDFVLAYRLLILNNFAGAFLFLPLSLYRIQERSRLFASLTFLRSFGTVLVRLLLVIVLRWSVTGIVLADVVVTAALLIATAGTMRSMLTWRFSAAKARELLGYGLPHVPHGLLTQTMSMADRFVLGMYMPLRDVGLYLIGSTIAGVIKFYPVAFEAAWMPFAFDSLDRPDARKLFARMGTYAFGILVLITVVLGALAPLAMALLLPASYRPVAPLVPLLAVAMAIQSLSWFLMTSINVAKETRLYPLITAIGAGVSIGTNVLLIPRFGMLGAALALMASQTITTGVTAFFAQRAYRIPYEGGRLAKLMAVGLAVYAIMTLTGPSAMWLALAWRTVLILLFPLGLLALGFFQPHELTEMKRVGGMG